MIVKEYLHHYRMKITALSPVHIGDGTLIGKKEYIQLKFRGPVLIPDLSRMFGDLCAMGKEQAFESFLLKNNKDSLGQWLQMEKIPEKKIASWKRYALDSGDAFIRPQNGKAATPKGILSFIKDAYGMPYVPGSSLKGMIRTALLAAEIEWDKRRYDGCLQAVSDGARRGGKRNTYLKKETDGLEAEVFHRLSRNEKSKGNAVNSILSGLIVSDSQPISTDKLTLSQKIDYSLDGKEKPLPILREALVPGTEILFDVTIDSNVCPYTIEDILEALDYFQQVSYRTFYSRFRRGSDMPGTVWLGGGAGFLSKTILYPAFKEQAVEIADTVFKNTLGKNYEVHKHGQDRRKRLAPHVCKCTRYQGRLYDMGMGQIECLEGDRFR